MTRSRHKEIDVVYKCMCTSVTESMVPYFKNICRRGHNTVTLYAAEDDRKLDREKFHSTHANSHLPNGELGGYGYNANNIFVYIHIFFFIMLIEKINGYTLLITTFTET